MSLLTDRFASRPTRRHLASVLDITTSSPNSQPEPPVALCFNWPRS